MTPKAAYESASIRARRLLRLHDGLINLRRYRIRRDWRGAFCTLMHWPKSSALERVDTKDAVIVLRDGSSLAPDDFTADTLGDLLRLALTCAVSGLDRYVHERVVRRIIAALKKRSLLKRQQDLAIPAVLALQAAEAVRRASRQGHETRPANEVRKHIQQTLHRQPFQSWRQIEDAFELIGVNGLRGTLQAAYQIEDFGEIRRQLDDIVDRRNRVVHEADLKRHARGGRVKLNPISRKYVEESLNFVDDLVAKLEKVPEEGTQAV